MSTIPQNEFWTCAVCGRPAHYRCDHRQVVRSRERVVRMCPGVVILRGKARRPVRFRVTGFWICMGQSLRTVHRVWITAVHGGATLKSTSGPQKVFTVEKTKVCGRCLCEHHVRELDVELHTCGMH